MGECSYFGMPVSSLGNRERKALRWFRATRLVWIIFWGSLSFSKICREISLIICALALDCMNAPFFPLCVLDKLCFASSGCDSGGPVAGSEIQLTEWFFYFFIFFLENFCLRGIKKIFLDGFSLVFVYKMLSSFFSSMEHYFKCTVNVFS